MKSALLSLTSHISRISSRFDFADHRHGETVAKVQYICESTIVVGEVRSVLGGFASVAVCFETFGTDVF